MYANIDDISLYSEEFVKLLNEKIHYLSQMVKIIESGKKPSYGFVPKKISESITGSNKYKQELDLLMQIKADYNKFCEYSLVPFSINAGLVDCLSSLAATLSSEEQEELYIKINSVLSNINREKLDDFLELQSSLLFKTNPYKGINFGQEIIELDVSHGVSPTLSANDIINIIGRNKMDEYKRKLAKYKNIVPKKVVPLGTFGIYELLNRVEAYIESGNYLEDNESIIQMVNNFDEIKFTIIELERLSNRNDYLLSAISSLRAMGENKLNDLIKYLEILLQRCIDSSNELTDSISSYPLEQLIRATFKEENITL